MDERFLRNEMLWGWEAQQRLAKSHVILFGLGGVGSYTAECLARSGVGELTLVDSDTVSVTNINRQLEALTSTVGQPKAEAVAARIRDEIQSKVSEAGLEIIEARITYLAYAPEIAAVMLQRQQASAIIDARKMIVDGAVGMVEMALERLSENKTVELDEERKAAMVSNLLVVLCGSKDAQPIVNSGSLY